MLKQEFQTRRALGGDATIVLVAPETKALEQVFNKLWAEVYKFESRFSRFLPGSELTRFNVRAGLETSVSEEFEGILRKSLEMSSLTKGLHNPFVLPALQRQGYGSSAVDGYRKDDWPDYRSRAITSHKRLNIKSGKAEIPYNTALDLGGLGKGYLADLLSKTLEEEGLHGYWISLSGDVIVKGVDEQNKPWKVQIQSADGLSEICPVSIKTVGGKLGIATSGTFHRPGQNNGSWHHIIDPATGSSAKTDIKLATVIADDALSADVLASCAVILGSKVAATFLKSKGVLAYVLQTKKQIVSSGTMLDYAREKEGVSV